MDCCQPGHIVENSSEPWRTSFSGMGEKQQFGSESAPCDSEIKTLQFIAVGVAIKAQKFSL